MSFRLFSQLSPFALAVMHSYSYPGMSTSACLGGNIYGTRDRRHEGVRENAYCECTCQLAVIHAAVTSVRLCVRYMYMCVCACVFLSVCVRADIRECAEHRIYRPYTWPALESSVCGYDCARRVWQKHVCTYVRGVPKMTCTCDYNSHGKLFILRENILVFRESY